MLAVAATLSFAACNDDDDEGVGGGDNLTIDKVAVDFSADANAPQVIRITSAAEGLKAVPDADWIKAETTDKTVTISVMPNETGKDRMGHVTVSDSNSPEIKVLVKQSKDKGTSKPEGTVKVTPDNYEFKAEGETKEFAVATELQGIQVKYEGAEGIKVDSFDDNKITVTAAANATDTPLAGKLSITHKDLKAPVTVNLTQKAKDGQTPPMPAVTYQFKDGGAVPAEGIFLMNFVSKENPEEQLVLAGTTASSKDINSFVLAEGEYAVGVKQDNALIPGSLKVEDNKLSVLPCYFGKFDAQGNCKIADVSFIKEGSMTVKKAGEGYELTLKFTNTGMTADQQGKVTETPAPMPTFEGTITTPAITFMDLTPNGGGDNPGGGDEPETEIPEGGIATFETIAEGNYTATSGTPGLSPVGLDPVTEWKGALTYLKDDKGGQSYVFSDFAAKDVKLILNYVADKKNIVLDTKTTVATADGDTTTGRAALFVKEGDEWKISKETIVPAYDEKTKTLSFAKKDAKGLDIYMGIIAFDAAGEMSGSFTPLYRDIKVTLAAAPQDDNKDKPNGGSENVVFSGNAVMVRTSDIINLDSFNSSSRFANLGARTVQF